MEREVILDIYILTNMKEDTILIC